MRRSTLIIMSILMLAFGAIFAAANSALGPLAHDADVSKELTQLLAYRGDIMEGSRVRALRAKASDKRLAEEGLGLVVNIWPSEAVRQRRGALRSLAFRAAEEAQRLYPGARLDWFEVAFRIDEVGGTERQIRTLMLSSGEEGVLSDPRPPLPLTLTVASH